MSSTQESSEEVSYFRGFVTGVVAGATTATLGLLLFRKSRNSRHGHFEKHKKHTGGEPHERDTHSGNTMD